MQHKSTIVGGIILILLVVGMFVFAYLKKAELQVPSSSVPTAVTPSVSTSPYSQITRIDAKHFFIDGTHTIVGEIPMPTSCDLLNWDTSIAESFPEKVTVHFSVVNNSDSCPQTVTPQRFKVTFTASEKADIRATLMGRNIELNLIPPASGETPEDFELFIKG